MTALSDVIVHQEKLPVLHMVVINMLIVVSGMVTKIVTVNEVIKEMGRCVREVWKNSCTIIILGN